MSFLSKLKEKKDDDIPVFENKNEIKELIINDFEESQNPGIFVKNIMSEYSVESVYDVLHNLFYNGNIDEFSTALLFCNFVCSHTDFIPSRAAVPLKEYLEEKDLLNQYFNYALESNKYSFLNSIFPYIELEKEQIKTYISKYTSESPVLLITLFDMYREKNNNDFDAELINSINIQNDDITFFIKTAIIQNSCYDEFQKLEFMKNLLPKCPEFYKERYISDINIQKKLTDGEEILDLFNFSSIDLAVVLYNFIDSFDGEKLISAIKEALETEKEFPYVQ